jgi:hypothetical protein
MLKIRKTTVSFAKGDKKWKKTQSGRNHSANSSIADFPLGEI